MGATTKKTNSQMTRLFVDSCENRYGQVLAESVLILVAVILAATIAYGALGAKVATEILSVTAIF
jgi:hypothetical protein